MTVQMAQTGAKVHAFEPDPHAFSCLSEAVEGFENVTLHNAAIGDQDGTLTLTRDKRFHERPDYYSVGTGAFPSVLNEPGGESFDVPMIGLRGFLETLDGPVDLAKMDIEGSEVATLNDLLDTGRIDRIKKLYVETHEAQMPDLRLKTKALRKRVARLNNPDICLDWK